MEPPPLEPQPTEQGMELEMRVVKGVLSVEENELENAKEFRAAIIGLRGELFASITTRHINGKPASVVHNIALMKL